MHGWRPHAAAVDRRPSCSVVLVHGCAQQLVHEPIHPEILIDYHSYIRPHAFHVLCIPQRKCVVVAAGHYDTVWFDGIQYVNRPIARDNIVTPGCGAPVGNEWYGGDNDTFPLWYAQYV